MGEISETHGAYLAPVASDRDGSLLLLCGVDAETGRWRHDGLAAWCPACKRFVTGLLATSADVDIDGGDAETVARWMTVEAQIQAEHQAFIAASVAGVGRLVT